MHTSKNNVTYPRPQKQWVLSSSWKQSKAEDKDGLECMDGTITSLSTTEDAVDQCPTCGIQTHSTIVKTRASFFRKKCTESRFPITIEGAVLAGRCILCHPIRELNADEQPETRTNTTIVDQAVQAPIKSHATEGGSHQVEPTSVMVDCNESAPLFQSKFCPTEMRCLALVAHNGMKPAMKDFVIAHQNVLRKFRLTGTNSTMTMIREVFGNDPNVVYGPTCASGPLGGDAELVSLMVNKSLGGCFFFSDPMSAHPHTADIECLNRQANVHEIVMCPNLTSAATALATFQVALKEGLPKLIPSFFESLESPTVKSYKEGQGKLLSSVSSKLISYGSDLIPFVASTRASLPYDLKHSVPPSVAATHPSLETSIAIVSSRRQSSVVESRRSYGINGKSNSDKNFLVSIGLSETEAKAVIKVAGITSSKDLSFFQDEAMLEQVIQESALKIIPAKKLSKAIEALSKEEESFSGGDLFVSASGSFHI